MHWNHSGEARDIIGSIDPASLRETADGLFVRGQLDLDDSEVARQAWRSMKRDAVALSFGFAVLDERERPDGVNELRQIDLFEVSIVPHPANQDTRILSTKAAGDHREEREGESLLRIFRDLEAMQRAGLFDEAPARKSTSTAVRVERFEVE